MERKPIAILAIGLVLVGCSVPGPTLVAPATTVETVSVSGAAATGVSPRFSLKGGTYGLEWTVVATDGGCAFTLFLATQPNGPSVEQEVALPTSGGTQGGRADWAAVPPGSYVLQEDRSGVSNCSGAWTATLTAK